jgi:hypothetical protein
MGSCEHVNENFGSIGSGETINDLSNYLTEARLFCMDCDANKISDVFLI